MYESSVHSYVMQLRALWYTASSILRSTAVQRKGMVIVAYFIRQERQSEEEASSSLNNHHKEQLKLLDSAISILRALPAKICKVHICYHSDSWIRTFALQKLLGFTSFARDRCQLHEGE